DAPIIVGTMGWSSLGVSGGGTYQDIVNNPLANQGNLMYTFHFYAASHGANYQQAVTSASAVLPLFVTEWGTVSATGGGTPDLNQSTTWLNLLDSKKISWANWTYSDANETSAAFNVGHCGESGTANLSQSGAFVRGRMLSPADNFPTGGGTDTQAPSAPSNLTSPSKTSSSVNLSWTGSTDNVGVTGYQVFNGSILVSTVTGTTATVTGLNASTTYTFTVKARDAAGNVSAASNALNVTTNAASGDTTAPSAPTNLTSPSKTDTSVSLSWTGSTDNVGVTGYQVFRGSTLVSTVTGTTATVTGLTASTAYTFTVKATDAAGNVSAASNALSVTTNAPTGGGGVKAQHKNNDASPTDNQIKPGLQLVNTGTSTVTLSTVTVRYWFSKEAGASTFATWCDYALKGCGNITQKIVAVTGKANADSYFEVGFTSGAGTLAPGANTGDIQNRFNKTDWSSFTESNDYSYGTGTSYADNAKMTVYVNGALVWGTEPA
ncbi:MAG: endo,4-beta-xylanase, partial [Gaiellaceae bacterium]|nr:endo,4-beta-xylanase [Gaiellaceae bacterium]